MKDEYEKNSEKKHTKKFYILDMQSTLERALRKKNCKKHESVWEIFLQL